MGLVRIGVDVGQLHDPTAICVAAEELHDVQTPEGTRPESVYVVRWIERLPLGTSYPAVAMRIAEVVGRVSEAQPSASLWLVLDSTGVGRPVVDIVREALGSRSVRIAAATFTATDRVEGGLRSPEIRVGKAWMVSRMQVLLQSGRIHLPDTSEVKALVRELLDYDLKVTDSASFMAGAFKTGSHDDMVTALGLSVLEPARPRTRSRLNAMADVNAEFHGESKWNADGVPRPEPASSGPTWGGQSRDGEMERWGWHKPGLGRQDGGGSW